MRHLAAVIPLLFLVWYLAGAFYWLYGHPVVTPFSLVQVQPTLVIVGPSDADPMTFPQGWLLSPPGEYQDGWGRLFVSTALAWWHNIYLLGLSMLLLAAALLVTALVACTPAASDDDGEVYATGPMAPAPDKAAEAVPVVVDTDLAPDDLAALALLVRHPEVEVVAITVSQTGQLGCVGRGLVADL